MADNKRLLFIYNPFSGKGIVKKHLPEINDVFQKAGYRVTEHATVGKNDATEVICSAGKEYDRIVISGGDGTLREAVKGFVISDKQIPLGYLPSGSTNDFGNSIGLPTDVLEAARIAVGEKIAPIDIGTFNREFFVYIAAFGLFTEIAYETDQNLKHVMGHAAYVLSAGKSVLDIPAYKMRFEADGRVIEDHFIYGMISNSKNVGGMSFLIRGEVDLSDGLFEILLVRYPDNPIELIDALTYLSRMRSKSNLVYHLQANTIRIQSDGDIPWTLDGEFGGNHSDAEVFNRKHAIRMVTGI